MLAATALLGVLVKTKHISPRWRGGIGYAIDGDNIMHIATSNNILSSVTICILVPQRVQLKYETKS